jgi:hypothetical protein
VSAVNIKDAAAEVYRAIAPSTARSSLVSCCAQAGEDSRLAAQRLRLVIRLSLAAALTVGFAIGSAIVLLAGRLVVQDRVG